MSHVKYLFICKLFHIIHTSEAFITLDVSKVCRWVAGGRWPVAGDRSLVVVGGSRTGSRLRGHQAHGGTSAQEDLIHRLSGLPASGGVLRLAGGNRLSGSFALPEGTGSAEASPYRREPAQRELRPTSWLEQVLIVLGRWCLSVGGEGWIRYTNSGCA